MLSAFFDRGCWLADIRCSYSFCAVSSACLASVCSVFSSSTMLSMSCITPLLFPSFFWYAPNVSGGGGGTAFDAERICANTVMPVPAMPVCAARRNEDALLLRQLTALQGLVQVRAVELVELVLRRLHQLRRRLVLGLRLDEGRVLLLALLSGLGNRLVEGLDLGLERLDLARKRRHRRRHLLNGRRKARQRVLRVLLLRRRLLELGVAKVLLRVIVALLLGKHAHHAVDLLRDLREIHGLALQRRRNQAQLRLVRAAHLRQRHQHALRAKHLRRLRALLQEAHARLAERRRRLLEEVQRVVIVQDLDRLADRIHLLRAHRLALAPGRLLRRALLAQISQESLRLSNVRLRVLHVVLRLDDLDRDLAS